MAKTTVKQAANVVIGLHILHRANEHGTEVTPELANSVLSELAGTHQLAGVRKQAAKLSGQSAKKEASKNHNNDSPNYRGTVK